MKIQTLKLSTSVVVASAMALIAGVPAFASPAPLPTPEPSSWVAFAIGGAALLTLFVRARRPAKQSQ
jgi:hypothetical protein